jgi:calcium permeable stress-gated cation channel
MRWWRGYSSVRFPASAQSEPLLTTSTGFVMVLVARERIFLIGLRQAYLLSKPNAARLSSRTVLFLSAPKEVIKEEYLRRIFGNGARKQWVATNLDDLESLVSDRNDSAMMLEAAEVKWLQNVNKKRLQGSHKSNINNSYRLEDGGEISAVDKESRPTHTLVPLVGERVDTINWSRTQVSEKAKQVQETRESVSKIGPKHGCAVFVEFATQAAAQRAYQQLSYHQPLHLDPRYIGVQPKEVIWKNLSLSPANRISRGYIATAFIAATILLWSIPIGIVGTISNINYLAQQFHFLRFINNLPDSVLGLITGLLPPYLISELVSYVPKFFRCKYNAGTFRF